MTSGESRLFEFSWAAIDTCSDIIPERYGENEATLSAFLREYANRKDTRQNAAEIECFGSPTSSHGHLLSNLKSHGVTRIFSRREISRVLNVRIRVSYTLEASEQFSLEERISAAFSK